MPNMLRLNAGPKIIQQKIKRGRKISKYKNQSEFFCRHSRHAENRSVNSANMKVMVFAGVRTNLLEMIKIAKGLTSTLRMLDISWTRMPHEIDTAKQMTKIRNTLAELVEPAGIQSQTPSE